MCETLGTVLSGCSYSFFRWKHCHESRPSCRFISRTDYLALSTTYGLQRVCRGQWGWRQGKGKAEVVFKPKDQELLSHWNLLFLFLGALGPPLSSIPSGATHADLGLGRAEWDQWWAVKQRGKCLCFPSSSLPSRASQEFKKIKKSSLPFTTTLFCLYEEESAWLRVNVEQVGKEETNLHPPPCQNGSLLSCPAESPLQFPILQVSLPHPPLSLSPTFIALLSWCSALALGICCPCPCMLTQPFFCLVGWENRGEDSSLQGASGQCTPGLPDIVPPGTTKKMSLYT